MKILITGGTGFVGSRLAVLHASRNDEVRILGQTNTPAERENSLITQQAGCDLMLGSVTDSAAVEEAVNGVELVYHLAAAQHESNVGDQHFWNTNVEGTRSMLEASVQAGVRRFVHGSSIGVYRADPGTIVDETSPTEPDNIYGVTKLEAEAVVADYMARIGCVIVRISETYGPGDRRLLKLFSAVARSKYLHIGGGENLHHLLYIDDLTNALRLAGLSAAAVGQTIVVPGFEAVSTRGMVSLIAKSLGVPVPRRSLPLAPLWLMASAMEFTMRPLGLRPPLHRRRMHFFVKSFRFEGTRALTLLGYKPATPAEDGLRVTAEWYRSHGDL